MSKFLHTSEDFKEKFRSYTRTQCKFALMDINETIVLQGQDRFDAPYIQKLLAEKDAITERITELEVSENSRKHAIDDILTQHLQTKSVNELMRMAYDAGFDRARKYDN